MLMLAKLTFRETLAKKTFIAFFGVSTLFLLLLIFAFQVDIVKGSDAMLNVFGNDISDGGLEEFNMENIIQGFMGVTATALITGGIFLSIFATAGLIPSMLEKGTIDLILSKPLSRFEVLFGRSIGAMSIVFINISYLIIGIWMILGLKTGIWMFEFLTLVPVICLVFFIMFCWMMLFGVTLRSSALTIMITYMMYGVSGMLIGRDQIYALLSGKFWIYILDGFYYTVPRIVEMMSFPVRRYLEQEAVSYDPFINSFVVSLIVFGVATYIFTKKDF